MKLSYKEVEKKKEFFNLWLDDPASYPKLNNQKKVARFLGLNENTLVKWKKERSLAIPEGYDSSAFLESRTAKIDEALLRACEKSSPQALKIYYQLTQRLVEHQEVDVKIGLSADERYRREFEADNELRDEGFIRGQGVEEVSEEHPLLPDEVCLHPEQEYSTDN